MPELSYEHGAIEGMVQELKNFVTTMDTHLNQTVEASFAPLVAGAWQGLAATGFFDAKKEWEAASVDLQQGLTNFSNTVANANTDMQATDQRLVDLFA